MIPAKTAVWMIGPFAKTKSLFLKTETISFGIHRRASATALRDVADFNPTSTMSGVPEEFTCVNFLLIIGYKANEKERHLVALYLFYSDSHTYSTGCINQVMYCAGSLTVPGSFTYISYPDQRGLAVPLAIKAPINFPHASGVAS